MKLTVSILMLSALTFGQSSKSTSLEDLMRQVLGGIAANDAASVAELSISKDEFKKFVWPNIAAAVSGPAGGASADRFFENYQKSNDVGMKQDLAQLGGKKWEIVRVTPGPIQKKAKDYTLFLAPEIVVRDDARQEKTIKPVGGVLEHNGVFKVTTYFLASRSN